MGAMRRRNQLAGMNSSSHGAQAEGRVAQGFAADRSNFLGQLYDQERSRSEAKQVNKVNMANTVGSLDRQLEQAENQAAYEAIMQQVLFPYQQQAQLAQVLLNDDFDRYQPQYMMQDSQYSQMMNAAQPFIQGVGGFMGFGGGPGGLQGVMQGLGLF